MGHEFDLLWTILRPFMLQAVFTDLLFQLIRLFVFRGAFVAFFQYDDGLDDRPPVAVFCCYHCGFPDRWVCLEHGFDFDGACVGQVSLFFFSLVIDMKKKSPWWNEHTDSVAGRDDHVVCTALIPVVPVFIKPGSIPSQVPALAVFVGDHRHCD